MSDEDIEKEVEELVDWASKRHGSQLKCAVRATPHTGRAGCVFVLIYLRSMAGPLRHFLTIENKDLGRAKGCWRAVVAGSIKELRRYREERGSGLYACRSVDIFAQVQDVMSRFRRGHLYDPTKLYVGRRQLAQLAQLAQLESEAVEMTRESCDCASGISEVAGLVVIEVNESDHMVAM